MHCQHLEIHVHDEIHDSLYMHIGAQASKEEVHIEGMTVHGYLFWPVTLANIEPS